MPTAEPTEARIKPQRVPKFLVFFCFIASPVRPQKIRPGKASGAAALFILPAPQAFPQTVHILAHCTVKVKEPRCKPFRNRKFTIAIPGSIGGSIWDKLSCFALPMASVAVLMRLLWALAEAAHGGLS